MMYPKMPGPSPEWVFVPDKIIAQAADHFMELTGGNMNAFWAFVQANAANYDAWTGYYMPEHIAHKINVLAGPYYHAMFKAWQAQTSIGTK